MTRGDLLTTAEATQYLKISKPTFLKYIHLGKLRAARVGKGWKITQSELDRFLNRVSLFEVKTIDCRITDAERSVFTRVLRKLWSMNFREHEPTWRTLQCVLWLIAHDVPDTQPIVDG
jgi:excisionase family DNA binding protein